MIEFEIKNFLRNNNKPISDFKLIEEYLKEKGLEEQNVEKYLNDFYVDDYPIQYKVGYEYFLNHKIFVDQEVLIPRMETEEVVYKLYNEIKKKYPRNSKLNILDLCTGSGAITIALFYLLKEDYELYLHASDISKTALKVAKHNFEFHNIKVKIIESDLFNEIDGEFDVIVSNPPYIPYDGELSKSVLKHEPHLALFADDNGLKIYKEIIKEAQVYLKDNFILCFEIGFNQGDEIVNYSKDNLQAKSYEFFTDLNNNERIVLIKG